MFGVMRTGQHRHVPHDWVVNSEFNEIELLHYKVDFTNWNGIYKKYGLIVILVFVHCRPKCNIPNGHTLFLH